METAPKARSPFAHALHDLLHATEGMDLERWTLWLNPWYAKVDAEGKPTGTRIMPMGPCGDVFDDPPTDEQVRAYWDELAKNWRPCHKLGEGVTTPQIQRWLADEEMPSMRHLVQILGYLDCKQRSPDEQRALDRFDEVLRMPPHEATPFGEHFRRLAAPTTCIGVHVFFERYGVITSMHRLPMAKWEEFFASAVGHFEKPR